MMRKWMWIAVPAVVVFVYKTQLEDRDAKKSATELEKTSVSMTATLASTIPVPNPLLQKLREEALNIGQIQDPAIAQKNMEDLAAQVKVEDVEELRNKSMDPSINTDERSLAVQVLALSELPEAQVALKDVASSAPPDHREERKNLEEGVLRAQAVEGLKSAESLTEVITKTELSFVADRAQRALNHLAKGSPTPQEQDEKALKKVLE